MSYVYVSSQHMSIASVSHLNYHSHAITVRVSTYKQERLNYRFEETLLRVMLFISTLIDRLYLSEL